MSSLKSYNFTSFQIWMPFIFFSCLITQTRNPCTMLNNSGKSKYPYLAPDLTGKAFYILSLSLILAEGSSYGLYYIEVLSFYSYLIEFFNHK